MSGTYNDCLICGNPMIGYCFLSGWIIYCNISNCRKYHCTDRYDLFNIINSSYIVERRIDNVTIIVKKYDSAFFITIDKLLSVQEIFSLTEDKIKKYLILS